MKADRYAHRVLATVVVGASQAGEFRAESFVAPAGTRVIQDAEVVGSDTAGVYGGALHLANDGEYNQGVYVLTGKIKQGPSRVKVEPLGPVLHPSGRDHRRLELNENDEIRASIRVGERWSATATLK